MNNLQLLALSLLATLVSRSAGPDDTLRQELLDRHAEVVARACTMSDELAETPAFIAAAAILEFLASEPRLRLIPAPAGFAARHALPRHRAGSAMGDLYVDHLRLPSGEYTFQIKHTEAPGVFALLDEMNPQR